MHKVLKILRRANQNNYFQYKNSNAYRNFSARTGNPGSFPEGSNVRDLQGTFRRLSGNQYKNL